MRFHLKAVGKAGVVSMTVEAPGHSEARRIVEDQGLRVVSLHEIGRASCRERV